MKSGSVVAQFFPHCLVIALVLGLLTAGLWPFHAPANEVTWLGNTPGLRFGEYASIISRDPFPERRPPCDHTVEIFLEPGDLHDSNTFLTFYQPERAASFRLRQAGVDAMVERQDRPSGGLTARMYVSDAFSRVRPVVITVVAGKSGTSAYLDGAPVRSSTFQLESGLFSGRLLLANSPYSNDSWSGRLLGLALYDRALTSAEIAKDAAAWKQVGRLAPASDASLRALYLFNEQRGDVAHSAVTGAPDLIIPPHYFVLDHQRLDPFWQEFDWTPGFLKDVVINVGGFIPFGFVFRAWLSSRRRNRRAGLIAIAAGFLISFTIEFVQSFLPNRQSGTMDLITNTLGTAIGVAAFRWCPTVLRDLLHRSRVALASESDRSPQSPASRDLGLSPKI